MNYAFQGSDMTLHVQCLNWDFVIFLASIEKNDLNKCFPIFI